LTTVNQWPQYRRWFKTNGAQRHGRRAVLGRGLGLAASMLIGAQVWARPQTAPRRIVAYLDIDRPGAREAYARFLRAVDERQLRDRFGIDPMFVAVDQTSPAEVAALPARIRELRPFALVATSLPTIGVARDLGISTVFFCPPDPVSTGFVQSLRRPGGTMTGYTGRLGMVDKMLEALADGFPRAKAVAVLVDGVYARTVTSEAEIRRIAREQHVEAEVVRIDTLDLWERFASRELARFDALAIPYTVVPFLHGDRMIGEINRRRVPALFQSTRLVRAGGLMGVEADVSEGSAVFARQIEAIARGVPPGEIPVERARLFRLSLNLATARASGLRFPASLIKRADLIVT
jgi:putative ABC transport system substrate-binding protein